MLAKLRFGVHYPAGIYLFKVNNRNTRARCKICSSVYIVNFEDVIVGWVIEIAHQPFHVFLCGYELP